MSWRMPWATTYRGFGPGDLAAAEIEAVLKQLGMECRREASDCGELTVLGKQQPPWPLALLRALPQRAEWRIKQAPGRVLEITGDVRLSRWYSAVVLLLCVGFTGCLLAGARGMANWSLATPPPTLLGDVGLLLSGLMFGLWIAHLLTALGGRRTAQAWDRVIACVERAGGFLELARAGLRFRLAFVGFTGYAVALVLWIVVGHGPSTPSPAMAGFLAGLLTLVLVLVAVASLLATSPAFGLRTSPFLCGLASAFAMVALLAVPAPWWAIATHADAGWAILDALEGVGHDEPGAGGAGPWALAESRHRQALLPLLGWLAIAFSAIAAGVGWRLLHLAVDSALYGWPTIHRLQAHGRRGGGDRLAVGSGPGAQLARSLAFVLWSLLAGLLLIGLTLDLRFATQAVLRPASSRGLQLSAMSGRLLAAALGRPQEDRWTGAVARGLWGLHGLAILALPAVSVGRLLFQHRRNDREIATAAADDTTGRQAEIQALLEELQPPGAGRLAVRVVIREAPSFLPAGLLQDGLASAQRFGLWRTGRLIALSPRALDRLERDELRALLAHELAHHLLGHCTIADVARWLGRLTFVGDGFARAVLDSFGFEIEADRLAVKVLGGQAGGLVRCLEKLAADRAPNAKRRPAEQTAIGYSQIKAKAGRRLAWWLFWKQYTSGALHGWHPSHATRLEALRGEGTKR